jgi:hypothetical protein
MNKDNKTIPVEEKENKQVETKVENSKTDPKLPEPKVFEYADLALFCHSCRKQTLLDGNNHINIQGGINIGLGTNDQAALTLSCAHCGNIISLHFVEAANPPAKEEKTESEDSTENKEVTNDVKGESKTEVTTA